MTAAGPLTSRIHDLGDCGDTDVFGDWLVKREQGRSHVTCELRENDSMRFLTLIKSAEDFRTGAPPAGHWQGWEGETEVRPVIEVSGSGAAHG
jgi:hypothetical protein